MANHTSAPWDYDAGSYTIYSLADQQREIADICDQENGLADAMLIAAAPDLLQACIEFVRSWDTYRDQVVPVSASEPIAIVNARRAIAKAEGTA